MYATCHAEVVAGTEAAYKAGLVQKLGTSARKRYGVATSGGGPQSHVRLSDAHEEFEARNGRLKQQGFCIDNSRFTAAMIQGLHHFMGCWKHKTLICNGFFG